MKKVTKTEMGKALDWCNCALASIEVMSDHSKAHGGHESSTRRLRAPIGYCYVKVHQSRSQEPLALVVSELPGQIVENAQLSPTKERAAWRAAGSALVALHDWGTGECFGPCLRDGTYVQQCAENAREYVSKRLKSQIERAIRAGYINDEELATVHAAYELTPAFEGERATPCHRDYCAANWLVSKEGTWAGVTDFEFAHWDVRVADFSRYPDWSWIGRPDLVDAFFEGYGRSLNSAEEQQLLVAHAEYALGAIL